MNALYIVSGIVLFVGAMVAISYVAADYIDKKYLINIKDR